MDDHQLPFPWARGEGYDQPASADRPVVTRRQRGYQIFLAGGVKKLHRRKEWRVTSQTIENAYYLVRWILGRFVCNCQDFFDRQEPCKHIHATQFFEHKEERDSPPDLPVNVIPLRRDWKTYNSTKPWVQTYVAQLLLALARVLEESTAEARKSAGADCGASFCMRHARLCA